MHPVLIIVLIVVAGAGLLAWLGRPTYQSGPKTPTSVSKRGGRPSAPYVGDFTGPVAVEYAPKPDGVPDPGEVVWTWVPFAEDHTRGKDRPVLLVGRDGPWLLGLQMTSQVRAGSTGGRDGRWVMIGAGSWDARRRPSAVRVDRIVRVDPAAVRRDGAILDEQRFNMVTHSLKRL